MFQPNDPTQSAPDSPDFQIDPYRAPYFQIVQPEVGSDRWQEVGFVWTMGTSRTSSIEHWYLYDSVPRGGELATYAWPGWDASGRLVGTHFRLVPATAPAGQTPSTLATWLERTKNVSITYIKGTMGAGR